MEGDEAKLMKKALMTEALRSIWKTRSRFLSILAIVAVGTGFFAGIKACTPDMMMTTEDYFKEYNLSDIHLVSTFGFDEKDMAAIEAQDGIKAVMPSYSAELFADMVENSDTIIKVYSMPLDKDFNDPSWMNRPVLKEGRLPEKKGECLVERGKNTPKNFVIGASVKLKTDADSELSDMLDCAEYTVVGIAESPYYLNSDRGSASIGDGVVDTFIMIPEEHFCFEDDIYTDVHLKMTLPDGLSPFDDDYEEKIKAYRLVFEDIGAIRSQARYDEIMDEATEELNNAKAELADGIETQQRELADARQKIADAEKEIADGEQEYYDGLKTFEKEIAEAEQELNDAEAELKDGRKKLDDGWAEYYESDSELYQGKKAFEEAKAEAEAGFAQAEEQIAQLESTIADIEEQIAQLDMAYESGAIGDLEYLISKELAEDGLAEAQGYLVQAEQAAADGKAQLAEAESELKSADRQLDEAYEQLIEAEKELYDGEKKLADGGEEFYEEKAKAEQELRDAQKKIADGKKELEQAKIDLAEGEAESNAEIADAKEKIADAEKELSELELPEWYVWDREDFGGYASFRDDMMKVDAIAAVFPVFFILVAGLVCLTTMSRMVEEERTQIGTLKALGYSKAAIMSKYLIYSIGASLLGSVLGLSVGFKLFPEIIISVYRTMYTIPDPMTPFRWDYALWCTGAAVLCTAFVAVMSCRKELKSCPAQLMRPKAPKAGKRVLLERISPLWNRLSFTYKVTLRNVFRYKRRAFMTIIGVAGCTALMVAGFGIRHAIGAIVNRQYGEIFCYDAIVALDESTEEEKEQLLDFVLDNELTDSAILALQDTATVSNEEKELEVYMVSPQTDEGLNDYIVLRDRKSHEALSLAEGQVIINEKLSKVMDLSVGDNITLAYEDKSKEVSISAITENYTLNYVYLLPETYSELFRTVPNYNTVIANMTDTAQESRLSKELLENEKILGISYASNGNEKFMDMVNSLDIIVWVLIGSAGLLAIIVLYNLANININERVRELATIKVLGFYDKEVSAYVYRENNISTALGIALGLILGTILEQFALVVVEADDMMFAPDLPWTVFVYSAVLTVVFAEIINIVVHFKLKKINMVESMKSVE